MRHLPRRLRTFRRLLALAVVLGLGAACGASSSSSAATFRTGSAGASAERVAGGHLNVLAAASLAAAFNDIKAALTSSNRPLRVTYSFGGSNALVAQIQQGAPADVFASADQRNMTALVTAGLVDAPVAFARNKLQIAVAAGNPRRITGLADLARPDVSMVLEAPGVPAGDYTRQVASNLGVTLEPRSLETDVKSALTKVTSGEVDATVVYVTDVRAAGAKVTGVDVPADQQPVIDYPIAIVKATRNRAAAEAFLRAATSAPGRQALVTEGFIAP